MSDMKGAFERLVGTAPPLRDVDEVLAEARRSTRRRARFTALGSTLAVLAIVGLAAVALPPGLAGPVAPPAAAPDPTGPPTARAAPIHSRQMLEVLLQAVPPGYAVTTARRLGDDDSTATTAAGTESRGVLLAGAYVLITRGNGQGELIAAMVSDGRPPPTGDLCAPANTASQTTEFCEVIVVAGVPIQVTTSAVDAGAGRRSVATRFLWGGRLVVAGWQGVPANVSPTTWGPAYSGWLLDAPQLAEPPLTAPQLAALAASPAMLQFP